MGFLTKTLRSKTSNIFLCFFILLHTEIRKPEGGIITNEINIKSSTTGKQMCKNTKNDTHTTKKNSLNSCSKEKKGKELKNLGESNIGPF